MGVPPPSLNFQFNIYHAKRHRALQAAEKLFTHASTAREVAERGGDFVFQVEDFWDLGCAYGKKQTKE